MSDTTGRGWRIAAWSGAVLFALVLLVSAFLKSRSPNEAAAGMLWTGLDRPLRVALSDALSVIEAVIAALLLVSGRVRLVPLAGGLLAVVLLIGHALGMLLGDAEHCGCFGDLAVPDWLTMACVVIGLGACGYLYVRHVPRAPGPRKLLVLVPVIAGVALVPLFSRFSAKPSDTRPPIERLLSRFGMDDETEDILFLIGSWTCPHCRKDLDEFTAARRESADLARLKLFFVSRQSDKDKDKTLPLDFVVPETIEDDLWWDLLIDAPPTYIYVDPDVPRERRKSWRLK